MKVRFLIPNRAFTLHDSVGIYPQDLQNRNTSFDFFEYIASLTL